MVSVPISFSGNKWLASLFPSEESLKTDAEGRLTPESIAEVQKRFPAMTTEMAKATISLDDLKELLTVEAILLYLKDKLSKTAC